MFNRRAFLASLVLPSLAKAADGLLLDVPEVRHLEKTPLGFSERIDQDGLLIDPGKPRPQVWATSTNCMECIAEAQAALAAEALDLPFDVIWMPKFPGFIGPRESPSFWWAVDTLNPLDSKVAGKILEGWQSVGHLVDAWSRSRKDFSSAANSAPRKKYVRQSNGWKGLNPPNDKNGYINHLMNGDFHAGHFKREVLQQMDVNELAALHSDHHYGAVNWALVNGVVVPEKPKAVQTTQKVQAQVSASTCLKCQKRRQFLFWEID